MKSGEKFECKDDVFFGTLSDLLNEFDAEVTERLGKWEVDGIPSKGHETLYWSIVEDAVRTKFVATRTKLNSSGLSHTVKYEKDLVIVDFETPEDAVQFKLMID